MKILTVLVPMVLLAGTFQASGVAASEKAAACTACHGANGISVSDDIPNLAGQREKYLAAQLTAFRAGDRKNKLMNAMAAQLSDADIEQLATFFSALPAGGASETSAAGEAVARSRVSFAADFARSFTHYRTANRADLNQVRYFHANDVAMQAAAADRPLPDGSYILIEAYKAKLGADGKPVTGADGFFVKDTIAAFIAMAREPGWGDGIPPALRNADWNYAVFKADGSRKEGVNFAKCLACHKPLGDQSFVFSIEDLTAKAKAAR